MHIFQKQLYFTLKAGTLSAFFITRAQRTTIIFYSGYLLSQTGAWQIALNIFLCNYGQIA